MYKLRKTEDIRVYFDEVENTYSEASKSWKFVYSWLDSVIFALVVIFVVFTVLFRVVGVNGRSMVPTLHNGDWLAVKAINMHYDRGDIVVITQPNKLNDQLLKEDYIAEPTNRMFDVAFPVTVPEGCVFVMGDNRNDSLDSRSTIIGFIDTRYLLGTAEFRFFPVGEWKIG